MVKKEDTKEPEIIKPDFPLLSKAEETAKRIEEANLKFEENLRRQEEILSRQILGGKSMAGSVPVEEKPISDLEYSKRFLKGEIKIQ